MQLKIIRNLARQPRAPVGADPGADLPVRSYGVWAPAHVRFTPRSGTGSAEAAREDLDDPQRQLGLLAHEVLEVLA